MVARVLIHASGWVSEEAEPIMSQATHAKESTDARTEPRITGPWTEPIEQGGANYWGCSDCGRESLRRGDLERSEFHAEECSIR